MLVMDTKVDVKYKDGGVRIEKIPKAVFTVGIFEDGVEKDYK
jgi:hypothetical protein